MANTVFTCVPASPLSLNYTLQDSENAPVGRIEFNTTGLFVTFPAAIYFKDDRYAVIKEPGWFSTGLVLLDLQQLDAGKSEEESLLAMGTTPLFTPIYKRYIVTLKPVDYESANYGTYLLGENFNRFNVFTSYGGNVGESLGSLDLINPLSKSVVMTIDSQIPVPIQLFFFVVCIQYLRGALSGRHIPIEQRDQLL